VILDVDEGAAGEAAVETALFYVSSEALANAVKHAQASQVTVDLHRTGRRLELRVADDGRGGADPKGSGLTGLADRVAAVGGRLRVDSSPGAGTVVAAVVPG
jgi:signal transduction histidine kinase